MYFIFVDWIKWCGRTCFFHPALMMEAAGFSEISAFLSDYMASCPRKM
jgi:hypothetical protein